MTNKWSVREINYVMHNPRNTVRHKLHFLKTINPEVVSKNGLKVLKKWREAYNVSGKLSYA